MPNLIITYNCNETCEFCFADKANNKEFKFEQINNRFQFIKSFNRTGINIAGGEPTLNKDFLAIVTFLLSQNQKVTVFTNGNIQKELVESLTLLSDNDLLFCVNRSNAKQTSMLTYFYRKLGYRIMLGVTIYKKDQKLDHIAEEINKYKLNSTFRLGIGLPNWPDKTNRYINPEEYVVIAGEIITFIKRGLNDGIKPFFDCGFPYCFFDEEQKKFLLHHDIDFKSNCGIIPDIYYDNTMVPCLPLKSIIQPYSKESEWEEIEPLMKDSLNQFKKLPLFGKCNSCEEIAQGNCNGGCAAFRLVY